MELRNTNPRNLKNNKNDYSFMINDWQTYNEKPDDDYDDPDSAYEDNEKYIIQVFGVDEENKSVSVKITGFKPRFYVNIPNDWNDMKINVLISEVKKKVNKRYKDSICKHTILHRKKFRGFTNNEKFKFIKLTFNNTRSMNAYVKIFEKKIMISSLHSKPKKYDLYESNIEAFLRFCHIQDLKTSGWVTLPKNKYTILKAKYTYCQRELSIKWKDVKPCEKNEIAPLIICSYDIECDSSHGDFPLAKKNYKKLSAELLDNIHNRFKRLEKKNKKELKAFISDKENHPKLVKRLIKLAFVDNKNSEEISYCYTKDSIKPTDKEIDNILNKITDILFTRIVREENYKELREAVDIVKKIWSNQSLDLLKSTALTVGKEHGIPRDKILRRIITRDILVEKMTDLFDDHFPDLEGDKVIQIGSTINRYGEDKCFLKHIITLDTCNKIEGAVVVPCKTEKEVIIEWFKFIRELDPDIVTGYNIFGFDYKFIFIRAEELNILEDCGTLSRMKSKGLRLDEKNLSSSALGENILTYINMEGRVNMDLLKIVQKDHKLVSYKLDNVAETFINGPIKDIDKEDNKILTVGNVKDLQKLNYITIFFKNDKYLDGKKFQILKIKDNKIYLDTEIPTDILEKGPSYRLAKDDIGPKDIFRLQKESAEGRTIVAQYCIQDCQLVNKLVAKLSIISNNIGMANVCSVPLSYIFLRGQGVKIFSLVSKECREHDFLLPVLKKPKTDDDKDKKKIKKYKSYFEDLSDSEEEDEGGYEGAIVLPPTPGIYLDEPVTVLDYSSLYPSCMISDNLSHDTYVMEDKYDNLPGYEYLDKTYDVFEWIDPNIKSKGKKKVGQKTCRFVQFKNGEKGVIPMILQKLLKARKTTRKKIPYKTVTAKDGTTFSGLLEKDLDDKMIMKNVEGESMEFVKKDIESIKDTYSEFEKEILDGLQLAYKLTGNSLYGQIGARTSSIYLKDIAASTTATGRGLLYLAKEKTEEKFDGAKIVYGDSVPEWELLKLNINNKEVIEQVKDIKDKYFIYNNNDKNIENNKNYYIPKNEFNIQTYTKEGLTKVITLMEHYSNNNIIKIITETGTVNVTNEHSLILECGKVVTPKEINIGDILMSYDNNKAIIKEIIDLGKTNDKVYDLTTENHHFQAGNGNIVVHNTDSIFISFNPKDEEGNKIKGKEGLKKSIELGVKAEEYIQQFLKPPHKLEYEKTFWPFILFTKKRYIGNKYEFDLDKYKQTSMGIVLKRRDNADIVKHVYGGIMNIIMKEKDIKKSIEFLKKELKELVKGKFPLEMLTITKSLKSYYKNPESIAHKVLADRIGEREPGNKPLPNDRLPYIYIQVEEKKGVKLLQGDKIETPTFIKENNLKPNYLFYITNQIKKPVCQIYALIVDQLEGYNYDKDYLDRLYQSYLDKHDVKKANEKLTNKKNELAGEILFGDIERDATNKKNNIKPITSYFMVKPKN